MLLKYKQEKQKMKSKNINNLFLGFTFSLLSVIISYLLITKKIKIFIHPRMIKFFIAGLIFMIMISIGQFIAFFKSNHKEHFKYMILLFILPLIFGKCINTSNISSNISENKNVSLIKNKANDDSKISNKKDNDFLHMDVINVNDNNYYNVMDAISSNMDAYNGKKISLSGFVYRNPSIKHDEFVAARMLLICCTADAQIIGFLCKTPNAPAFKNNEWVKVTGTINIEEISYESMKSKMKYPVIIASKIKKMEKPINQYIYPNY